MRKAVFSRDDVVTAGLTVVDREGLAGLSARKVADELGASTAPVYSNFGNMEELADAVKRAAVAGLLNATRQAATENAFMDMGIGVLRFVWEHPATYAALFIDPGDGYDPGPDFMQALVDTTVSLAELDSLPPVERIIVLKKMAFFTHGLATEICQGCGESCTLETMTILLVEVGEAVLAHARVGIPRDPDVTELLSVIEKDSYRRTSLHKPGKK